MEALGAPRQNSSPNPRLESIEVYADLRHRTYARFRIGTVTHNPDVVCTTSTRAEMQPVHVQLGNLGNAGSEVIIYASDASFGYIHDIRRLTRWRRTQKQRMNINKSCIS
jgi:hypothetical protein